MFECPGTDLTLPAEPLEPLRALAGKRPRVTVLSLERPRVIPELVQESAALLAIFGVSDEALFDVLMGRFTPGGKLPFELSSSMEAVRAPLEDMPHDSRNPLFPIGFGLSYGAPGSWSGRPGGLLHREERFPI